MDAYEATRIVFSRIQSLDPENAAKIMGLLLIQDHGEKEMIRLAFGPEALVHSVVLKARKDLGLLPSSTPAAAASPCHFILARQNSSSRLGLAPLSPLSISSPSSWAPPPVFSRTNSNGSALNGSADDVVQNPTDELVSPSNPAAAPPFYGGADLIDEFQLQDQLSFLNDAQASSPIPVGPKSGPAGGDLFYRDVECRSPSGDANGMLFPYGAGWGANGHHRRSCSVSDLCLGSDPAGAGFGWKPCLYFARGYCKNGSACRFVHGLPDDTATAAVAAMTGGNKMDTMVEQQCQELLLRSKSQRLGGASQLTASAFPYSPTGSVPPSPSSGKCLNFFLQQQQSENQRYSLFHFIDSNFSFSVVNGSKQRYRLSNSDRAAAAAALMLGGDESHKFMGGSRMERSDFSGMVNPGSRQIYLTFPADSTFREEDVSNYFSIYGPVQDVRIPYQQKRMFGFVTFVYPETVKLILAKGNPHFVCDARVLVKPYKEKGKVPDKKQQQQQQAERGDFSGCSTPIGLDSRDSYDLQQLVDWRGGARMLYNGNSSPDVLLRRKLEVQQQEAELQQAIALQHRRFMGLQLLDLKTRSFSSSIATSTISTPPTITVPSLDSRSNGGIQEDSPSEDTNSSSAAPGAAPDLKGNCSFPGLLRQTPVNPAQREESSSEANPKDDSDFQGGAEHNLPDSPFASPTRSSLTLDSAVGEAENVAASATATVSCNGTNSSTNNHLITSTLLPTTSSLDMTSLKSCFFQMPRFSSGQGAVRM